MKLTQQQQAIFGIILVLLVFLLCEFVFFTGKKDQIANVKRQIEDYQQKIHEAELIKKHAAELQEEMNHLEAQLDRLKKILPPDINKPKFYQDIRRYANENQLEVVKLSNNKPLATNVVVEHPFTFHLKGKYHDLGGFFAKVSNYPRILNAKGLFLDRVEESTDISAQFIISVYTYKEPTEEELKAQVEARKLERQGGDKNDRRRKRH